MNNPLLSVTALDGRYASKVESLNQYFSEAALIRYRILVEVEWFIFMFNEIQLKGTRVLKPSELKLLRSIYEEFDVEDGQRVKDIEKTTNHDVKAVEYFIKEKLKDGPIEKYLEFIHFSCTSEDINNLSYSCMVRDFVEREYVFMVSMMIQKIYAMAVKYKKVPMMSRTHGQPASPTTVGKELLNFVARLERELTILVEGNFLMGKINGAVGNYNAHYVTYPEVDWMAQSEAFVASLGLVPNLYTAQIEPHDCLADVFDSVKRINNIVLDFDRDMWSYISLGFFKQKTVKGEVGSSTMPHKVNPIDFENSEGNIGLANAMLEHMGSKLQISRWQRDLSDSTVQRNIGAAFAYAVLAYKGTIKGLSKCEVNKELIKSDIEDRWELLAEPIQMMMRKHLMPGAYEKLKELTRGKGGITKAVVAKFLGSLDIPAADKKRLLALTPEKYIGLAVELVDNYQLGIAAANEGGCGSGGCGGCKGC